SSEASPQPCNPATSVSTRTNTQLRMPALTTRGRMAVIFMMAFGCPQRGTEGAHNASVFALFCGQTAWRCSRFPDAHDAQFTGRQLETHAGSRLVPIERLPAHNPAAPLHHE